MTRLNAAVRNAGLFGLLASVAVFDIGAAPVSSVSFSGAHAAASQGLCILGFIDCDPAPSDPSPTTPAPGTTQTQTPTPTPSGAPAPGQTSTAIPGPGDPTPTSQKPSVLAPADPSAPVLTTTVGKMKGSSLSIGGLKSLGPVTVTRADGSTVRMLRIVADKVVVGDFSLDTRDAHGDGVLTTSSQMTASGGTTVYAKSITGILADGAKVVIDALTAPSTSTLAALTDLSLPLYGISAGSITMLDSHEAIS